MDLQEVSPTFSRPSLSSSTLCQIGVYQIAARFVVGALTAVLVACGGSAGTGSTSSLTSQAATQIQVAVSPTNATLTPNAQQVFTAVVRGTSNSAVRWLASAGSITSSGTFTAPPATSGAPITITATSLADSTQQATSVVTLQPVAPLSVTASSLTAGTVGTAYSASLSATGGTPPYLWTLSSGTLAPGIQLQATGTLTGTASQQGNYPFTAKVTDAASHSATQTFTLAVSAATSGAAYDGPAELPRVYLQTTMADTPAPGTVVTVNAGGDLQTALNNANCGDTIELQAGATFTGTFLTFPSKPCDDQHWIIVRTATPDSALPPEGTRMTPCFVGIASLPGRPAYPCPKPQHLLSTLVFTGVDDGPIVFASGANHYRLLGLEITRTAANGKSVTALIAPEQALAMSQIVLDRMYIHGTPGDETRRAVYLSGGTSIAVQDSYISEIHCHVLGTCTDSQAIAGGSGSLPMGPYRIVDNFLEAAGENIIFGGGPATQTPADIEVRRNHFFKPLFWLEGQAGFTPPAYIVKNHFEIKNAQRVLFDSNILDDNWGGFSQNGYSIVITPRNPSGDDGGTCPICQVTDITIRYITMSHTGGVFQIANPLSPPLNTPAFHGERYSLHDVIADDVNAATYDGLGNFAEVSTSAVASALLQNVMINHITAFAPHELFNVGAPNPLQMSGFTFTNSIVLSGEYPMWSTGAGGKINCANADVPLTTMNQCFTGYNFSYDAIISAPAEYPPSKWPAGNFFYSSPDALQFVNYNNGDGGDYHLLASSPAKNAASDGTDLGANVDLVLSDVSGVQ